MAGSLTMFGEVTIAGVLPGAGAMYLKMVADLQAQLDVALSLQARVAIKLPTLDAQIELVVALLAALRASVKLGLPGIDFQLSACVSAVAALEARIALLAGFPLGTAGVFAYAYDGDAASYGGTVGSVVGAGLPGGRPSDHINALILATSIPGTWAAMGKVLIQ